MALRILGRDGTPITTHDGWKVHGKPASEGHWVPGRSAWELAADWIDRDAEQRVLELLGLRPELSGLELVEGVAEKKTQFDESTRGPRNHDLLLRGRVDTGPVTIGVEGKADEPFDNPLQLWRDRALASSPRSAAPARIDRLTLAWFSTTLDTDAGQPPLSSLGYQLFSALAGTLADAKTDRSALAVLLVQEFDTIKTIEAKHQANAAAFDAFLLRLAGPDLERSVNPEGWITAPVDLKGDGIYLPANLPVMFAKLTRSPQLPGTDPPAVSP